MYLEETAQNLPSARLLHLQHVQLNTRSLTGQAIGVLRQPNLAGYIELKASKPPWAIPKKRVVSRKPATDEVWSPTEFLSSLLKLP